MGGGTSPERASKALLHLQSSKAEAHAAKTRINRLQRELLETRVAFATNSAIENKLSSVREYKAVQNAPKRLSVGSAPASEEEVVALSRMFNAQLDHPQLHQKYAMFSSDPSKKSWIRFFNFMDKDSSGQLRFAEFEAMARDELWIAQRDVSDRMLRAVWSALDSNASGFVSAGEFGAFMRRGERLANAGAISWQEKKRAMNKAMGDQVRADAENAYDRHVAAGVDPASVEELKALSEQFHKRLEEMHAEPSKRSWIKLFRHMDQAGTGKITYSEMVAMVREQLHYSPKELPSSVLRSVWAALDTASLGYIIVGEFGAFMRRGEGEGPPQRDMIRGGRGELERWRDRHSRTLQRAEQRKVAELERRRAKIRDMKTIRQGAIDASRDSKERKLAAALQDRAERDAGKIWARESGVAPASAETLAALATRFHQVLAQQVTDPSKRSWIKLFKHMDENGTGTITYTELASMIRDELHLSPQELGEKALQAVWAALDDKKNGFITAGIFGQFMRRGEPEAESVSKEQQITGIRWRPDQLREEAEELPRGAVEEADAPYETHFTVEVASAEAVLAVSEVLNRRLAEMSAHSRSKRSWFQLFNHMDADGTGRITYTEFEGAVRRDMQISTKEITTHALTAVWAALDTDSTGFVAAGEFGAFMRRGEHAVTRVDPKAARLAIAQQLRAALEAEGSQRMHEVARANAREARETEREAARLESMLRRERGNLQELTSRSASRAGSSRSSGVANPTARPITAGGDNKADNATARPVLYDGTGSPPPRPTADDDVLALRQRLAANGDADDEAEGWSERVTPLPSPRQPPRTSHSARGHASSSSELPMLSPYGPPTLGLGAPTSMRHGGGARGSPGRGPRDAPASPVRPYQHVPHQPAGGGGAVGPPSSARFATPRPPTSAR